MKLEQNRKVQDYLNAVCLQIKCREVHDQIRLELLGHIEEIIEELMQEDIPEEEAVDKAIRQMGDASSVGKQLHRAHKPRTEWSLLVLVGLFISFGLFTLYSIENSGLLKGVNSVFINSLIWFSLGLMLATGMYFFDYRKIKAYSWHLYLGTVLVWLAVLLFGSTVNGRQYVQLFFISFDFIGITPFLLTIALAGIFSRWDWNQKKCLIKTFVLLVIPFLFYFRSARIWDGILYAFVFWVLMRASGAKRTQSLLISAPPIIYIFLFFVTEPYRLSRLAAFIHPYRDPQGAGYLNVQINEAIRTAGFWGQGFTLTANKIPGIHTDLIFTYVVYTFGWIASLAILALAVILLIRMNRVASLAKDRYGRLLVNGLTSIFVIQFFLNILASVGLAPFTAFNLPFISYGGSQLIIQMLIMGLILSIYRRKDMVKIPQ